MAMQAVRAIEILERQRQASKALLKLSTKSPEFVKWRRDTEIAIERVFGPQTRNITDFKGVSYSLSVISSGTPDSAFHAAYQRGLSQADAILASMIDEVREYELDDAGSASVPDQLSLIERICLRFHRAARQLQARHAGRETIRIEDEYDVQDLLHALLRLHFDDVRPEEWTPSYAGRSARVDFLLKNERIVVEVKKSRPSMKAGDLGEELIIDRARYEHHPDCDTLVCFVYDPEGRIGNPAGIEHDLENHSGNLKVRVFIAPKS
ncbi:MAG TPA: hypothetical protein VMF90_06560 [Rhizobiaceae bacterium]|nr:hypothetical protein [Rhizobiaceae bacterium]